MAWFRCSINGQNFPGAMAGVPGLVGFFTTRFVEAADPAGAEEQGLDLLRSEARLAPPPGYQAKGIARLFFSQVIEWPAESVPDQQPGFVWYPMEADA